MRTDKFLCVHHECCCPSCEGDARIHTLNLSANNIGDRGAAALAEMLKVGSSHHMIHAISCILSIPLSLAVRNCSCCAVLCCAVLCCAVLCCAVLCCAANAEVAFLEQSAYLCVPADLKRWLLGKHYMHVSESLHGSPHADVTTLFTLPCDCMQVNTTLTHLELSGNVIDYDGITALSEALTDNQALHSLHIK